MRFPNHVSVVWDMVAYLDFVPVIGAFHDHLIIAPPAPPVYMPIAPSIEGWAPIVWPGGLVGGKHKLTDTVYHNHVWIALKGHDLGMGLAHISIPVNDALTVIHILRSSRKAGFGAGEVKADKEPIACCTIIDPPGLPTPMTVCGKVPMPSTGTGTATFGNSLLVGQSWVDWLRGAVAAILGMVLGYFGSRGSTMSAEEFEGLLADPMGQDDGGGMDLASVIDAVIVLAAQEYDGYAGDASLSHGGFEVQRSGEDGSLTASYERRRSLPLGEVTGRGEVRYHPDGHGGWTTDGGVSGDYRALGRQRGVDMSSDRGLRGTSEGWNSPVSEGTSWGDLPLL